jgi:glutamyl-tRNA synthetase
MTVRTRFAPSPTGHVHIGNMRAAIFNWLFARHAGGKFLLRIEDTDQERSTPEAIRNVLEAMLWLDLNFDGEPFYQSARRDAHLRAAETLLSKGLAYKADKGGTGQGEAIVFRMPKDRPLQFHDEIKGDLSKPADGIPDLVIVRSNGTPVFHLANVLDDIEMGITHVIRGDDHIENSYRHVALYQALDAPVPRFAHLPMIVNAQGKPYSKRDGDAYVGDFRGAGYLPEALFNYLALLGWSPGDDRELMTRPEMTRAFDLARVQSSPARMDLRKLEWMNGEYLRAMPPAQLQSACRETLRARGLISDDLPPAYLQRVVDLMRERLRKVDDIAEQAAYFFTEEYPVDEKAVRKRLHAPEAAGRLALLRDRFAMLEPFTASATEEALRALADERSEPAGPWVHPVRVAVSGLAGGPGLFEMLDTLGRDRVLVRIDRALAAIPTPPAG